MGTFIGIFMKWMETIRYRPNYLVVSHDGSTFYNATGSDSFEFPGQLLRVNNQFANDGMDMRQRSVGYLIYDAFIQYRPVSSVQLLVEARHRSMRSSG